MSKSNSSGGGIGVVGLLGVLFVGLKLGHVIDWSWWWVTVPFWGGFGGLAAVLAIYVVGALLVTFMKALTGGE